MSTGMAIISGTSRPCICGEFSIYSGPLSRWQSAARTGLASILAVLVTAPAPPRTLDVRHFPAALFGALGGERRQHVLDRRRRGLGEAGALDRDAFGFVAEVAQLRA